MHIKAVIRKRDDIAGIDVVGKNNNRNNKNNLRLFTPIFYYFIMRI